MARRGGKINKSHPAYIKLKGDAEKALKEISVNLQTIIDNMSIVTQDSLEEIGLTIKNRSDTYAPLDTGELRESSYVESEQQGDKTVVEIGYTADHAVYQHENYGDAYNNPSTPGTMPHFLLLATQQTEKEIPEIIADALRNEITK